jgi:hypothetical protein
MKGGNSGNNGSNLDKGNILKPTFDTLMEEVARHLKLATPILKSSSSCAVK